ncbi:MAG: hypothetical protein IJD79_03915 [Clostridia bacterium]|nr:hypothetical protein [Clostridia bacterium]
MKAFKYKVNATRDELVALLSNDGEVNKFVSITEKKGTPHMHVTARGEKVKIKCEYVGGASKDNAFIDGTKLHGKIVEREGYTEFSGVIMTAPIFHVLLFLMFAFFVAMCIVNRGFNVVPICLVIFDIFMYKDEFRKQGIIERYVYRAVKMLNKAKSEKE